MRHPYRSIATAAVLIASLGAPHAHASLLFGTNLVVNGDAEAGPSDPNGNAVASIPGFVSTAGNMTVVPYANTAGYPVATDPGPANRGNQLFVGGDSATSSITQNVSVADGAAAIDAGGVQFVLGAYLGGYATQNDFSSFSVSFLDAAGAVISTLSLVGPDANGRGNATGLVQEALSDFIPVGTRDLLFDLDATRLEGTANDGYADNLTFVANAAASLPPVVPPYSTGANRPCVTGTLQSYVDLGTAGCTIGVTTFYHFDANGTYAAVDPTAASGLGSAQSVDVLDDITVTPDSDGTAGFVYSSDSLFNVDSGYAQYGIDYYVDPPIDIVGFRLRDAPFVNSNVSADICVGNTFATNCANGNSGNEYQALIDDTHPVDELTFPPTTFNDVHLVATLDARNGPASIEGFGQSSLVAVPEPASLGLAGIGGLALLAATSRKRRRQARRRA